MTKRARLIVNPTSRTLPPRDRLAVLPAWLRLHGWTVDSFRTTGPEQATELAREAATLGYDVVIAAGGDGTVNEVVNGIARTGTALAVIPGGTANVWAREIQTPAHPGDVAALLVRGERRRLDLGLAGERYFLLMASLGVDSVTVAAMPSPAKQRFGRHAYLGRGLRELLHYRGVTARITADGTTWEMPLLMLLLGNTRSYGGVVAISHQADAADGLLDLVAYRAAGLFGFTGQMLGTFAAKHHLLPGTLYRRVRSVTISTDPPLPVQADGEIVGMTPMTFRIVPAALDVIIPVGLNLPVFASAPLVAGPTPDAEGRV